MQLRPRAHGALMTWNVGVSLLLTVKLHRIDLYIKKMLTLNTGSKTTFL